MMILRYLCLIAHPPKDGLAAIGLFGFGSSLGHCHKQVVGSLEMIIVG